MPKLLLQSTFGENSRTKYSFEEMIENYLQIKYSRFEYLFIASSISRKINDSQNALFYDLLFGASFYSFEKKILIKDIFIFWFKAFIAFSYKHRLSLSLKREKNQTIELDLVKIKV